MNYFQITILILLLTIIGLLIWNLNSLSSVKKTIGAKNDSSNLERYFDLKYRIHLIATIGSIIIFLSGIWGIKSYKDFEKDSLEQIGLHKMKLKEIDSTLSNIDFLFLEEKGIKLQNDLRKINTQTDQINDQIEKIRNDLKYKDYNVYYFSDLKLEFPNEKSHAVKTFYYKDLISDNIRFKSRPILIHSSSDGRGIINTREIDFFEIMFGSMYSSDYKERGYVLFDLIIIGEIY